MPEYRGFGLSGGRLSEETMYADAVVAFNYLKDRLGHDKIVVFGYSMGTAAASAAAGMCSADALILAAPFYSLEREVGDKPVPLARLVLKTVCNQTVLLPLIRGRCWLFTAVKTS